MGARGWMAAHEAMPGAAWRLTRQGWGHTFGFTMGGKGRDLLLTKQGRGLHGCRRGRDGGTHLVLKGGYVGAMPQQKAIANASAIARLNAGARAMA